MTLSDIRKELLLEHQQIRDVGCEILVAAERVSHNEPGARKALEDCLIRLESTVWRHNRREAELLDHVLPTVDAWGAERAQRMSAHHNIEYEETFEALVEARSQLDATRTCAILGDLLDHIAHEEEDYLCPSVLDDDSYDLSSCFGG